MENARDRRRRIRRANLLILITRAGGATGLARQLGKTDGYSKYLLAITAPNPDARGLGDDLAAEIEAKLGLHPGWMDEHHETEGTVAPGAARAQDLSQRALSDDLPLLSWEAVMNAKSVPDIFRTVLPDDALAPDFPRGVEVVWTTRRRAIPGRIVLVTDSHGALHARQCRQGREPGRWLAAAINPSYLSFDSAELRLVAVFKGVLEPDDQ